MFAEKRTEAKTTLSLDVPKTITLAGMGEDQVAPEKKISIHITALRMVFFRDFNHENKL